jgi:Domain of unknown function (DUF4326)
LGGQKFLSDSSYRPAGNDFYEFQKEHQRLKSGKKQVAQLTTDLQKVNAQLELSKSVSHARMTKPKRIQRSRAKGWKMPANAIYVGRPTVWGNPYVVGSQLMNGETLTAEKAVALYEQHLADNFSERDIRHCLHGKDLACWCALDEPCHADVLLRIANSRPK